MTEQEELDSQLDPRESREFKLSDPANFPIVPEQSSDDIREEMRSLALSSIYYLAKVVLGYDKLRPEPHGPLCDFIDFIENERLAGNFSLNRTAIYMPRDTYKCGEAEWVFWETRKLHTGLDPQTLKVRKQHFTFGERRQAPVYSLKTEYGKEARVTPNHPFLTFDGWKRLDELKPGDFIASPRRLPFGDIHDPEKAALFGYMIGDGNLPSMRFFSSDPTSLAEVRLLANKLGSGYTDLIYEDRTLAISLRGVRELFREEALEELKSSEKFAPLFVLHGDEPTVRAFLRTLFRCDGHRDDRQEQVVYVTISEQLARDVQHLLLKFGIPARLYEQWNRTQFDEPYRFFQVIFKDSAGIWVQQPERASYRDRMPPEWRNAIPRGWKGKLRRAGLRIDNQFATSREKVAAVADFIGSDELRTIVDSDLMWEEIREIKYLGEREILPIQADPDETITLGDLISHNTTICTISRGIQRGLRDPNTRGLILADTGNNAARFGTEISNHFKYNELLRWLFSELIPENFNTARWNANEMVLRRSSVWREPTFDLMGAGGGIETRHYDWIIADDLVTEKHIHSDAEMDHLIKWVGGLEPLLVNDTESFIDFVGSRKKKGDAYEHVEKYYSDDRPPLPLGPHAEMRGNLAVYSRSIKENGVIIFPYDPARKSGISEAYIERMKKHDPERYWAQLANAPKASGLNFFSRDMLQEAFWSDDGTIECWNKERCIHRASVWSLDRFLLYDPAMAEKQTSSMNAIIMVAKGSHPYRFVLESKCGHYQPDEAVETLFEWEQKWRPLFHSIEERGFQGSIKYWLHEKATREGLILPDVVKYPPEGSPRGSWAKPERIRGLQPAMRARLWWFVGGLEAHEELVDCLEFYPHVRWDDPADCLAQSLEFFPDALDESQQLAARAAESAFLERSGLGPILPYEMSIGGEEWNEEKWLASLNLDSTGYGVRRA